MDDSKQSPRHRAKALLVAGADWNNNGPPPDIERLIEELRVYQLELEMQNDELRSSQLALAAAEEECDNLYDFAPVGYFVCDMNGSIVKANLTDVSMTGFSKTSLVGTPIIRLIYEEDRDIFYLHRMRILETKASRLFDLRLVKEDRTSFHEQQDPVPLRFDAG